MGENINLLSERIIGNKGMDAGTRLELHENVHFHYRDSRFVWGGKDFYNIAEMFEKAKQEFIRLGKPENSNDAKLLAEVGLVDDGYHSNRLGCELTLDTGDNTIHIHYRDLRLHLKKADFLIFAETLYQGLLTLNGTNRVLLNIAGPEIIKENGGNGNISIPDIARNKYLSLLKEYDQGKYEMVCAEDVIKLYMETKFYERLGDKNIQRPNGLPDKYPGLIPEDIDNRYLYAVYESIKKHGYAEGPFYHEYIVAYKLNENKIYIIGAHRIASLIHLGYKEIMVTLVEPES